MQIYRAKGCDFCKNRGAVGRIAIMEILKMTSELQSIVNSGITEIKIAEESRVAIRNVRRDGNEHLKKIQKSGDMSEDDLRRSEHSIQELTDDFIKKVDESLQKKEKEIMEI